MPFDGQDQKSEVIILDRMRELLATPDLWCKGSLKTADGRMCLAGAFYEASPGPRKIKVWYALLRESGVRDLAEDFNDAPETKHSDILALIDAARERIINETTL